MTQNKCQYKFKHKDRTRDTCGLEAEDDKTCLCPLHDPTATNLHEKLLLLHHQLPLPDHWLEGIILRDVELPNLVAHKSKLPFSDLSDSIFDNAIFTESLLEHACLSSTQLKNSTMNKSILLEADMRGANLVNSHLELCNISGANFEGAYLDGAYLFAVKISPDTILKDVIWGLPGEYLNNQHSRASSVFKILSRYFNAIGEYRLSDIYYYLGMRSEHRSECGPASPISRRFWWTSNWLLWGYGVRPEWPIFWLTIVYLTFGLIVFPCIGVIEGNSISHTFTSGLALSSVTMATLGYGNITPAGRIGEILGGLEAVFGALLISCFLVSLATRFIRK